MLPGKAGLGPLALPPLRRLEALDALPALAWLRLRHRLAAHVPMLVALLVPVATFALVWTLSDPGPTAFVGGVLLAGMAFRVGRLALLALRRRLAMRAVNHTVQQQAQNLDDFQSLGDLPDGTVVSCLGRVRCRVPFKATGDRLAGVSVHFSSVNLDDDSMFSLGRLFAASPRIANRPTVGVFGLVNGTIFALGVAALKWLFSPRGFGAVFEAAQDFDVVDGAGRSVHVAVVDAVMLGERRERLADQPNAPELLHEMGAPVAAAAAARGLAALLREGDPVEVVGFKASVIVPDAAHVGRQPALTPIIRSDGRRPVLLMRAQVEPEDAPEIPEPTVSLE